MQIIVIQIIVNIIV